MKKIIKHILYGVLLFDATALLASEAYAPVAYGVKSRGMGGVGIATEHGAESGFENPALLSYLNKNEVSLGITYDNPSRKLEDSSGSYDMRAEDTYIPYFALNYKIGESLGLGLTLSKVKFQNDLVDDISTDIQKTRATIPLSYRFDNLSFGASFVVEKEKYIINNFTFSTTDYGFVLGAAYRFPQQGIMVAANYKSKIDHSFFATDHHFDLNSASEAGVGLHWKIPNSKSSIALDYKRIYSSKIYTSEANPAASKYFDDQNVYALGYSYDRRKWSFRAGYRYVSFLYKQDLLSRGYPYVSKSHYSIGGSYRFNKNFSSDFAVVYAPYSRTLDDGSTLTSDETSCSISLNYIF